MPTRSLPPNPNLDQLKRQAKDLLDARRAGDRVALQRIREFHPRFAGLPDAAIRDAPFALHDAQWAIAREHGYASWARLKRRVEEPTRADRVDLPAHERIEDAAFRRAVDLLDAGDAAGLREHLRAHPDLARRRVALEGGNYFREPSLLEFVAENPVRHERLAPNVLDVARVILDAGPEPASVSAALELVASGRVPRESGAQADLIALLAARGGDPDGAMLAALGHGEWGAVDALLRHGARLTLPVAAALGRAEDVARLLPTATPPERHLALALAAQHGRADAARLLLASGEDPNRYNPVGAHSHSTPLHQAAVNGHAEVVRLLLAAGADRTARDVLWGATPRGWAMHARRADVAALLD